MAQLADRMVEDAPPTEDEVRAYLRKLLDSHDFEASPRNKRFLQYVVEETLRGNGRRIKAYNIALAAFDRGEDFDPLVDPIVRIEAGRLRRSIEHYYLTAGKADPVRIEIPKGSYVAAFGRSGPDHAARPDDAVDRPPADKPDVPSISAPLTRPAAPSRPVGWRFLAAAGVVIAAVVWAGFQQFWSGVGPGDAADMLPRGPKIVVYPFEEIGDIAAQAFVSRGMTYDLIAYLTRFSDLFVYGPDTSFYLGAHRHETTDSAIQADYALTGTVFSTAATVRVSAVLADVRTGQYVWSWSNESPLTPANLRTAQTGIAEEVARAVAQPYGSVFERSAQEISGKPAVDLLSYECVVRFQQYWRTYDIKMYDDLVGCMTATIARDPGYARAYSSLALLYVDAYRFGYGADKLSSDPVKRALELADTAIDLEPNASDGYLALSVARWFDHNVEGGIEAAKQGLALNPNNTILLGELGIRYALLARWKESKAMTDRMFALNPRAPAGYRRANFAYAYMHGDYQTALTELLAAEAPLNIYDYVYRAMTYAQLGDAEKAQAAVAQILAIDPDYGAHVAEDFRKRNADPSIVRAIVDGLAKAGLPASTMDAAD
jgi:TolB-like protein